MLGLRFCARAFSSCGKWGPLFITVRGPLIIAASPVAERRLQTRRLSNCGSQAQLLHGMWDPPRPGLKPVSPALAGRFSTTAPTEKPHPGLLRSINQKLKTDITSSICITENLIKKLLTWVMQELRKQIRESEVGQELAKAGTIIISGPKRKKGEVVLPEPRMEPLGPDQEPWRIQSLPGKLPKIGGVGGRICSGFSLPPAFQSPAMVRTDLTQVKGN